MIVFFLLIAVTIPFVCIASNKIKNKHIVFDHEIVFSIGYLYYWILPMLVGILIDDDVNEGTVQFWYSFFSRLGEGQKEIFLLICMLFYCAYMLGSRAAIVGHIHHIKNEGKREINDIDLGYTFLTMLILPAFFYVAWKIQPYLFGGYTAGWGDNAWWETKGMLATLLLVSFAIYYMYTLRHWNYSKSVFKNLQNRYAILYLTCSIMMLSTGGRLYFMTTVISLIVFYGVYLQKLTIKKMAIVAIMGLTFAGMIGIVRQAQSESGDVWLAIGANIILEPALTSISSMTFIQSNDLPILADVKYPLSLFINLLPSFLFRDLRNEISVDLETEYDIESPLGALSSFVSWIGYFGILGSLAGLFIFGFLLSILKNRTDSTSHVIYGMLCGATMFTFFRDQFNISLIKIMIQDSVLAPLFIFIIIKCTNKIFGYKR
ncbi:oligosaccharide repeat unit polymerase [Mitsuokella jalaludinii]|uniref:O-antigen polymerase n=1 Tax=Mitsuokella jalaludinii TaxID=187979 RepID=UPI001D00C100|nr:O-antigen polymerase [Mitsuokella jalaludinii]MCB5725848.1 oligosaccharide repeat unit polymerase [Mitsuokella jalaludinii]